jgi:hypothetical protein
MRNENEDTRAVDVEWIKADEEAVIYKKGSLIVELGCREPYGIKINV